MNQDQLDRPCPAWLEDECLLIETSGEMPEVALQESLLNLPALDGASLDHLRAATARGYLRIIRRDLDHAQMGWPQFRGLERAAHNLARLEGYLARLGWPLPAPARRDLAGMLENYLAAEQADLAAGRPWASSGLGPVGQLARALGLDLGPWGDLLSALERLPAPDFRGLAALRRLGVAGATAKRRRLEPGGLVLEVLGPDGRSPLAQASLPVLGPAETPDPAALARAQLVWSLLNLPADPDSLDITCGAWPIS